MIDWKKRVAKVGLGVSLLMGVLVAPLHPSALEGNKILKNDSRIYTTAAIGMNTMGTQQNGQSPFSEDTLIIQYQKPLSIGEHRMMGARLIEQFPELQYAVVRIQDKKKRQQVIANYQKLNSVVSVNQSVLYHSYGFTDPKASEQYHLQQLQIEKAQKLAGSKKIKVAIIDTGMDIKHPELRGQFLPSYNSVNPMNPALPDAHGTHVAGILAGKKDNGIGGYGINPNAMILPIDVFNRNGGATDYAIAQGILYAVKSGAKVINMSLGGPASSPIIEAAVKQALAKNIVIIAAAGNEGSDWKNYPAGYEGVISVGNVDKNKRLASSSSFGPSVDLVAPGEAIYSSFYEFEKLSSFRTASGTSMASPIVAGVASLLLTKYPNLTPIQVEYILEHTAQDLGASGYDTKYGNGLINPVAALTFDSKKLPKILKKPLTEKEIVAQAKVINPSKPVTIKGLITKPYEESWVKFDVKKGESIQTVLEGSHLYDYKIKIHFYSKDGKKLVNVNDVGEGKAEGKLLVAPFTGIVAIGVSDVNGSFDDSGKRLSQYSLLVTKLTKLSDDESSLANPIHVESLPFETKNLPMTFIGEDGDYDYLTFSVKEKQVIKIETSSVPGVNSSIGIYNADMFQPVEIEENIEADVPEMESLLPDESIQIPPLFYANSKGKGEGEELTFVASPDTKYLVRFSNKANTVPFPYDRQLGYGGFSYFESEQGVSSIVPYSVLMTGKILPPDEDDFPIMESVPMEDPDIFVDGVEGTTNTLSKVETDPFFEETLPIIEAIARNHKASGHSTGYLQHMTDEDWFTITPSITGIYEFYFSNTSQLPLMEIYQVAKNRDMDGNEYAYFNPIGTNMGQNWSSVSMKQKLYTGLKEKETYYIKVSNNFIDNRISLDAYRFTSKLLIRNPEDKYEDNNELEKVKNIPALEFEGNFAMPHDQDVFYLQSKTSQIYGVKLERGTISRELSKYPKEIVGPFYGSMTIFEDTNKNRKVDGNEQLTAQVIEKGYQTGSTFGSFNAEKGKNYIIVLNGYTDGFTPFSLLPYKVTMGSVNKKDEDLGNKIIKNRPTKPIALKSNNDYLWDAAGYLNSGIGFGDEDWYTFTLDRQAKGTIKLETPLEVDGKIELYHNGALVAAADFYPEGQTEILAVNLKKGQYHIKIRDYFGNVTLTPYYLKIYMK
jgi:cell wall-associated protease